MTRSSSPCRVFAPSRQLVHRSGVDYTRSGGLWSQQGGKLVGTDAVGAYGPQQGFSVALSGDAGTAILGGIGDNSYTGAMGLCPAAPIVASHARQWHYRFGNARRPILAVFLHVCAQCHLRQRELLDH